MVSEKLEQRGLGLWITENLAPQAILAAPCLGSVLRRLLPVPAHHLRPEAGELGEEGAEQHWTRCAGAAIQQQRPSQPEDLCGATWKPGSRISLQDRGQRHHPLGYHGATVRTTSAFTAEPSPCHFVEAVALYHVHICKEGQKLNKSLLYQRNPLRPILYPGQLLKLLKTGTEKEVKLPNLSSPSIQLVEKMWKIYAIAAGEG